MIGLFSYEVGLFADVSASFHMCRSLLTEDWDSLKMLISLFELCEANDACQVCLLFINVCICICVYIHVYVYIHIHIHDMCVHTCMCLHTYIYIHRYAMYVFTCVCISSLVCLLR